MDTLPPEYHDLFEKRSIAHLGTVAPDGAPHVTPTWVDREGDVVLVNTVRGRRKERNVRADDRVALSICDPANPYRHVAIRGTVDEVTTEGADEHVDELAARYLGVDRYPNRDDEDGERILLEIRPESVSTFHRPAPSTTGLLRYALRRLKGALPL